MHYINCIDCIALYVIYTEFITFTGTPSGRSKKSADEPVRYLRAERSNWMDVCSHTVYCGVISMRNTMNQSDSIKTWVALVVTVFDTRTQGLVD